MTAVERGRTGRRNRVRPDGLLVADPARGTLWGNRGSLLGAAGEPTRRPATRAWVCCVLQFKGRRRIQWQPGRLTELYFLDEATALAAGHRPCGECRIADYRRFQQAWAAAFGGARPGAPEMDRRLHDDRVGADGRQRTYLADPRTLPDGVMIRGPGGPGLWHAGRWLPWAMSGYGRPERISGTTQVPVLTPAVTVEVIRAGYLPLIHPSAG